jgi:hypothetical protein
MRSDLVTGAYKQVPNRYLLTCAAAKTIRAFRRPNARVANTANQVLLRFSSGDAFARDQSASFRKEPNCAVRVESDSPLIRPRAAESCRELAALHWSAT